MRGLDAYDLQVLRGVEDGKAFDAGLNNTVTAHDLMIVLRALAEGRAASPAASARMIEILSGQEFNEKIPAGLPPGIRVAHKTGDITGVHHDAAIVYPPGGKPYVLVVLTAGFEEEKAADAAIADVSRAVWEAREGH
jgi:beta-lactamase class A